MFQKLSLRLKLSLSVALLSMVVLGIMTYLSAHQSFISAEDNARAISLNSARSYAGQVRSILEGPLTVARSIAQSLIGKKEFGEPSRDMISSELHRLLIDNKDLIGTWTGWEANALDGKDAQWVKKTGHDETGRFVPYWSYDKGVAYLSPLLAYDKPGDGDYYLTPKSRLKETLIEPYIYPVAGVPTLMTSAAIPIVINGRFQGVAGVDIGLKGIQTRMNDFKPFETSQAYLLSNSGAWVSHPQDALITKPAQFPFENDRLLGAVKAGEELTLIGRDPADGKDYLYTVVPVVMGHTEQPWALVVRTPNATVMAAAMSLLWTQLFISFIGVVLLIGSVATLAHYIAKSMGGLSQELHQSSDEVASAIHQLNGAGQSLSSSSSECAASIEETVASLEEMNSMVHRNSENAQVAADLSGESRKSVELGEKEMTGLIEQMTAIAASSKKIEEIINVIDDIAFQTNLLALNAAVEAARAGEQGKGFAVVAEAVRNLAQRSAIAAKDITDLIQTSVQQVDMGTQKAESSGKVLKNIATSIEKVSNLNQEIAKASQEQAIGVDQISKAMNQLDQVVQSNASAAEEIAASAEQINEQSRVMKSVVEKMNANIKGGDTQAADDTGVDHGSPSHSHSSSMKKAA